MPYVDSMEHAKQRKKTATAAKIAREERLKKDQEIMRKTDVGRKKPPKRKTYAAGSNVLDRENKGKSLSYEDALKQGTRADDPRNWEFFYEGAKMMAPRGVSKGDRENNSSKRIDINRVAAESKARRTGKDVYAVKKIEWETEQLKGKTKQATADRKATTGSRSGSTSVAKGVAAQKQLSNRRRGQVAGAFDATTKKRGAIA